MRIPAEQKIRGDVFLLIKKGREEGLKEGREEGREEGERKARISIAQTMKKIGLPPQQIVDITNLTLEEIMSI